ncbi:hypothetical protein HZH68_011363 [Vespula germanica]|uniref:Uncharacterized protein n=1 Tax=Vespula germanica TaxID=30212 RepID=A0A834N0Z8_VESGE|nr:hypothetical protein HZH68_011363 [Vespula germanica]
MSEKGEKRVNGGGKERYKPRIPEAPIPTVWNSSYFASPDLVPFPDSIESLKLCMSCRVGQEPPHVRTTLLKGSVRIVALVALPTKPIALAFRM